jgi:SH3-like domain-containing protein
VTRSARATGGRRAAAALLALASGLLACAIARPLPRQPDAQELLRSFDEGRARLDCSGCRYDFLRSEWMLEQGHYEALVLEILQSGDGSGRSWYLLGRVAEATGRAELALRYYDRSLTTPRHPITALWPLYEDLRYRVRRLAAPAARAAEPARAQPPRAAEIERVNVESLVVATRPGPVGAFVEKLRRGEAVDVLDRSGDWEQVRLADGRVGWVFGDYTSPPESEAAVASAAAPEADSKAEVEPAVRRSAPRPAARTAKRVASTKRPVAKAAAPAKAAASAKATAPARAPAASAAKAAQAPAARAEVAAKAALTPRELQRSGASGILGAPLPLGSSLAGRTHGAAGSDDHPTETYAIEAQAAEIVGFFERELASAGWRRTFVSSEYLVYFEKDDRTIGVLVDRKGGLFTLMGS